MTARCRSTTAADLDFVLELESEPDTAPYIAQSSRVEHLATIENEDEGHFIVESEEGVPVGFVILYQVGRPRVELRRVAIAEKGRGYGRFALQEAKRIVFEDWSAEVLWLDVFDFNTRARALYESEGWIAVGTASAKEVCGVKEGTAVVMECRCVGPPSS